MPLRLPRATRLTAVGITCGIGSMLVGSRQAGFRVVGNIEWRKYYHQKDSEGRSTFAENFPGAFMVHQVEDLTAIELAAATGCDLAIGHPECGLYSQMQGCNNFRVERSGGRPRSEKLKDPGDIPLFLDLIRELRPRFFVMDDLPKSFLACPMEEYTSRLPDYDLFPEVVSNWAYGNVQKRRVRMFMIGSLKSERWVFRPGEAEHDLTLGRILDDLPTMPTAGEIPNHDPHTESEPAGRALHMDYPWHRPTYGDLRKWFEDKPDGTSFRYHSPHLEDGGTKMKPGWYKARWEEHAPVVDGGSGHIHPLRNLPFTIRERARIQGFPDDFVFYGTRLNADGEWNHEKNMTMVKQTGKAMPIQFCRYVSGLIASHILKTEPTWAPTGVRLAKEDQYVNAAKTWFCENVGYADQKSACSSCWLYDRCTVRSEKYGIGPRIGLKVIEIGDPKPVKTPAAVLAVQILERRVVKTPSPPAKVPAVGTDIVRFSKPFAPRTAPAIPRVDLRKGDAPEDYHCQCEFCSELLGELRMPGEYYSRLERRAYYDPIESGKNGHAAKTPLHIARWAVQRFTKVGDWVLDPTAGAGTTIVEALVQGRSAAGMELQYREIVSANVGKHAVGKVKAVVGFGDARNLRAFLAGAKIPRPTLIVNNPPYSGDEHMTTFNVTEQRAALGDTSTTFSYNRELPNLAFLKEGDEYWRTMGTIYESAVDHLMPGGHFVVGVKDMMRRKKPFLLHKMLAELLVRIGGLRFVGTALLRHWPPTLAINTYEKIHGAKPAYYQTIVVFKKEG